MATSSMAGTSPVRIALIGFIAAAIAILIFHQGGFWTVAQALGSRTTAWSMIPTKPLGVPLLLSNMFWGGLWGVAGAFLIAKLPAPWRGMLGWIVFFATVPVLVSWFVAAPLKGQPLGNGFRMPIVFLVPVVYAFWGFGTWLIADQLNKLLPKS